MNLWTSNKNKKKLKYKFSKKTILSLKHHIVKIKKGKEEKKYSSKIRKETWIKILP